MSDFHSLKLTEIHSVASNYYSASADFFPIVTDLINTSRTTRSGDGYKVNLCTLAATLCCYEWSTCFNNIQTAYTYVNAGSGEWDQYITPLTLSYSNSSSNWDSFYTKLGECSAKWSASTTDDLFPLGTIHITLNPTNPGLLFPDTNWVRFGEGRVIVGQGVNISDGYLTSKNCFSRVGSKGGKYAVQLGLQEIPSHTHLGLICTLTKDENNTTDGNFHDRFDRGGHPLNDPAGRLITTDISGGAPIDGDVVAHCNVQPSFVVYMWKRV